LKTDIERIRSDLYAVEREIEIAPVTETVIRRRAELRNALDDNEKRYETLGCFTVIG
jgi:hypothetical protein